MNNPEESNQCKMWNRKLSSLCIAVEHAFGWLKSRFPYLHDIPGYDMKQIYHTIEALMVLHNILDELGDSPDDIEEYNGEEDVDVHDMRNQQTIWEHAMNADELYWSGLLCRKQLLRLL